MATRPQQSCALPILYICAIALQKENPVHVLLLFEMKYIFFLYN
jgi:hypothetical protein